MWWWLRRTPAVVGLALGYTLEPEPLCVNRVSIRPQPTRGSRGEVMALGSSRGGGGPARAVAGGRTPVWSSGGMAWDPAAAALRLSLALGVARGVSRGSSALPHPPLGDGQWLWTGPTERAA